MTKPVFPALVALLAALAVPILANAPAVSEVDPAQGLQNEDTRVTISGSGFTAEPGVGLLQGGPVLLGVADTAGFAAGVAFEDGRVFVADGENGLVVFDVTDPSAPSPLPGFALAGDAVDLAVSDHVVYLVAGALDGLPGGTLHVIDVGDPNGPVALTELPLPCAPGAVTVDGRYAFVVGGSSDDAACTGRLDTFDVGVPEQASPAGSAAVDGTPSDVEVAAGRAAVAAGDAGVQILDVQDPVTPVFVAGLPLPGQTLGVAVSPGTLHAVGTQGSHVVVLDPSSEPTLAGSVAVPGFAVAVHGRFLVVAGTDGLHTVDAGDPEEPVLSGYVRTPEQPLRLTVDGEVAYVASGPTGLMTVGVEDAAGPMALIGGASQAGGLIQVSGNHAYVADGLAIVHVFDISDPGVPVEVGLVPPFPFLYGGLIGPASLYLENDLLFAARWWGDGACNDTVCLPPGGSIRILDPSTEGTPGLVSYLSVTRRMMFAIASSPDRLYLLLRGRDTRLQVYDMADPATPVSLGTSQIYPGSVWAFTLATDGHLVAIPVHDAATSECRLDLFDASDPVAPVVLGTTAMSGCAPAVPGFRAVAISGERVVVIGAGLADEPGWLATFDIGDPANPVELGRLAAQRAFTGLRLDGDTAWVATDAGMDVVDLSDPGRPYLAGRYEIPGDPSDLDLEGQLVFLAGDAFRVLQQNPALGASGAISPSTVDVDVPAGCLSGPYHVRVTGEDGAFGALSNGFRVCVPRVLDATLTPLIGPEASPALVPVRRPVPWTLSLDGDDAFFGSPPSHDALALLPELPEDTVVRLLPGDGSGGVTIEIDLFPEVGQAVVRLAGDDPNEVDETWAECLRSGGVALPPLDDRTYGPVGLTVVSSRPVAHALSIAPGHDGIMVRPSPQARHRYEVDEGRLRAAMAWGMEADLTLAAKGVDALGCEATSEVGLRQTLAQLCAQLAASHPDLAIHCTREGPPAGAIGIRTREAAAGTQSLGRR
jgi:hypothetical protein